MKTIISSTVATCLLVSTLWAQGTPSKRLRPRTIKPLARSSRATVGRKVSLGRLFPGRLSRTIQVDVVDKVTAMARIQNRTWGAGKGLLGALDDKGNILRPMRLPFTDVAAIGNDAGGRLLVVDGATNSLFQVDPVKKRTVKLFSPKTLNAGGVENAAVLNVGKVLSVTSDGKGFAFLGVEAGYSSSIFEVDLRSKKLKNHAFAPGDGPTAMSFENGKLFVVDRRSAQLRCFDRSLKLSPDRISIPVGDARGLVIQGNKVKVLSPSKRGIVEFLTPVAVTSLALAPWKLTTPVRVAIDLSRVQLTPRKFAVLICGDVAESGYDEFWNDTVWMYKTLRSAGYARQNIYVLYGYGSDYASANPKYQSSETVTDFPATTTWVNTVFNGLKNGDAANGIYKMNANDSLFLWTFDHGGSGSTLCLRNGSLSKAAFSNLVNSLPYAKRAVHMQQCYSGGYVDTLKNAKTFVSTACRANELAHRADEEEVVGGRTYHHGEYNYHIISSFDKKKPTGAAVNADSNGSGNVSVKEAHNWNCAHENRSETPMSADLGGVGNSFVIK